VFFYLFYKRQNLIGAMFTGRKPASLVPPAEAITGSQVLKAVIIAAIVAAGVWWLISTAPPPPEVYY
jgi:hypothetical protein